MADGSSVATKSRPPFTVDQIRRFYRIECIDYERPGDGLLVGAGTGLMMAIMDQVPTLRYCIDTDILRPDEWQRFPDWLTLMERATSYVACSGWWSRADNGLKLANATKMLQQRPKVYFGLLERPSDWSHCDYFEDHAEFVSALRTF